VKPSADAFETRAKMMNPREVFHAELKTHAAGDGPGGVGMMQKSRAYDGVSAKMLGPGEREIDHLKDGKVVYTVIGKVSADGKSITTVSKGVNPVGQPVENTGVYDRVE
jgi:hypothetical protein